MKTQSYAAKAIAALLILACTPTVACAHEKASSLQTVTNPDIPLTMRFCGQDVNFDRVDMFERMDREITSLMYGHGNTLLTLKRANKYFPAMAKILKDNDVPEDVLYLACVESTLNPRAVSPAKAAGMWQFLADTGRQYGLEVGDEVDERYDYEKATLAACKYLKAAYKKYGDWPTVMASYNAGMGRISTELDKQQVDNSFDLWLNDETSRYVFRIMATKALMDNPSAFGFHLKANQLYQPLDYTEVTVDGPVDDWAQWAIDHGISYAQLREANGWIRARSLTNKAGKSYTVRIPTERSLNRTTSHKSTYNKNWIK